MSAIKLHLDSEEMAAVERYAATLEVKAEDVVYAALNRLMMTGRDPEVRADIVETKAWRGANLPLWSDTAHSVHAYEGRHDAEPRPSRFM